MRVWRCTVCDSLFEGEAPPDPCPLCQAGTDKFVEEPDREKASSRGVKDITRRFGYGIYVTCARKGEKLNGQVSNAVFQVTTNPTAIAISINRNNLTCEYIEETGLFTLNLLGEDHMRLVRRFGFRSGRDFDKFQKLDHGFTGNGTPYLPGAAGWMECRILREKTADVRTHRIFLADALDGELLDPDVTPMTYVYYRANRHR